MDVPVSLVHRPSVRAFNSLYYHQHRRASRRAMLHYAPFFFPLDGIGHWNRLYGPRGFLQYQCVVPHPYGKEAIRGILQRPAVAGIGSSLAVLKVFGDRSSPGLLSFPRPGITLSLDFAYQGGKTLRLLEQPDQIVLVAGGAVYPAKDARMSAKAFQQFFPHWQTLESFRDPRFSSSFWQRMTQE